MTAPHKIILIIFILFFPGYLRPVTEQFETPEKSFGSSSELNWWEHQREANKLFGEQEWDQALKHYRLSLKKLKAVKQDKKNAHTLDNLEVSIALVQHRKELGRIKPELIHRFTVVFIEEVDAVLYRDQKIVPGKKFKSTITKEYRAQTLEYLNHFRSLLESYTDGRISVEYKTYDLPLTATEFDETDWEQGPYSTVVRQFKFESLKNKDGALWDMAQFFQNTLEETDTYLWFWNGEGFSTTANGGGLSYPLVPYQLYTPLRGYVSAPIQWKISAIPHEFFHVTEWMGGISPTHGHTDYQRKHFPQWKGEWEYSYQWWQWKSHLSDQPVSTFDLRNKYRDYPDVELIKMNQEKIRGISLDKLRMAHHHGKQASDLQFQKKDLNAAWKQAQKALSYNPWQHQALRTGYDYHYNKNDLVTARTYISKLNEVQPKWWSYNLEVWLNLWKIKDYPGSIRSIDEAMPWMGLQEHKAAMHQSKGYAYKNLKQYDNAYIYFEKAYKNSTNDQRLSASAWEMGSSLVSKNNDYNNALRYFLKAVSIEPTDWRHRHIAWIYLYKLKDQDKAFKHYQLSLDYAKESRDKGHAWYYSGNARFDQKRYQDARQYYEKSLLYYKDPKDTANAHWQIGLTYEKEEADWGYPLKYFAEALSLHPTHHRWNHVAWVQQWKMKKYASAIKSYQKAMALTDDVDFIAGCSLWQGRAYYDLEEYQRAIQSFNMTLRYEDHPRYAEALFWKGFTLAEKLENIREGLPLIKRAVSLGYDNDYSRWALKKFTK